MAKGGMKRALLSLMLFFIVFLSYGPFYSELKDIQADENLTSNLIDLVVAIFPIFYVMLGFITLMLTFYYVIEEMT